MAEENNNEKIEKNEENEEVVGIFENIDFAYPLNEIIEELKDNGYPDAGKIVLNAMRDKILDISDVENDGTVYIALGMEGEDVWKGLDDNEIENEDNKCVQDRRVEIK